MFSQQPELDKNILMKAVREIESVEQNESFVVLNTDFYIIMVTSNVKLHF